MGKAAKKKETPSIHPYLSKGLAAIVLMALGAWVYGLIAGSSSIGDLEARSGAPSKAGTGSYDAYRAETEDPLWPVVKEVAERFLCGCGQCGDMPLVECVCEMPTGGIAEKRFIREQLTAGRTKADVILLVQNRFGRLLPVKSDLDILDSGSTASRPNPVR